MNKSDRNAVLCWCCHVVRGCKDCCKTCKGCNMMHTCEHDNWEVLGQTSAEAMEWYHAVSAAMRGDFVAKCVPEGIRRKVERLTAKPIELELFEY